MTDQANSSPTRVIKLGGSLLGNPSTPQRICRWLEIHSVSKSDASQPRQNVWIVGGGELVNTIREWDDKFSLDPKSTHWTCVDLMGVNARLLSAWFPEWPISDQLFQNDDQDNQIFLTSRWLRQQNIGLPESWATTSDAIAAALAEFIRADELVLLKSSDPPKELSLATLASSDFVDGQFLPQIRSFQNRKKIRFVNLSDDQFREASL